METRPYPDGDLQSKIATLVATMKNPDFWLNSEGFNGHYANFLSGDFCYEGAIPYLQGKLKKLAFYSHPIQSDTFERESVEMRAALKCYFCLAFSNPGIFKEMVLQKFSRIKERESSGGSSYTQNFLHNRGPSPEKLEMLEGLQDKMIKMAKEYELSEEKVVTQDVHRIIWESTVKGMEVLNGEKLPDMFQYENYLRLRNELDIAVAEAEGVYRRVAGSMSEDELLSFKGEILKDVNDGSMPSFAVLKSEIMSFKIIFPNL